MFVSHTDELVQEMRNPITNTVELRLSCTNPSILYHSYCTERQECLATIV